MSTPQVAERKDRCIYDEHTPPYLLTKFFEGVNKYMKNLDQSSTQRIFYAGQLVAISQSARLWTMEEKSLDQMYSALEYRINDQRDILAQ